MYTYKNWRNETNDKPIYIPIPTHLHNNIVAQGDWKLERKAAFTKGIEMLIRLWKIVQLVSARDLPGADQSGFNDPYIRIFLTPEVDTRKRETNVRPNEANPYFDEQFKFPVSQEDLTEKIITLQVSYYDSHGWLFLRVLALKWDWHHEMKCKGWVLTKSSLLSVCPNLMNNFKCIVKMEWNNGCSTYV